MNRKLTVTPVALMVALALGVTAAIAGTVRGGADPGVTADSVLLGGTAPLTGPASAYSSIARGAEAYFKYVNARGGVNGRMINYKYYDDGYSTPQSVQVTRQLVEQDKVFAVFNSLGTEQNLAVRDYLTEKKVPQLFVASGATTWGRDYARYPDTIGFQPTYEAEGWVYGKYLARTAPGARIAVLFQNDDYGKDLLSGLRRGLQRSKVKVVAAQPYEVTAPDVQSQIARLKASGADTLAIFATPKAAIQAFGSANKLNWKPKRVINNNVSSAANIMQAASEGGTQQAHRERRLDRFSQGSHRSSDAEGPGDQALPPGDEEIRAGRERQRRLLRLRDGCRVDGSRRLEEGRQGSDARVAAEGARPVQLVG